jgi:hypothetical protein
MLTTQGLTVQHRTSKAASIREKERSGLSNTGIVVTCMNATGTYVPTLIVFSEVIYKNSTISL